ncbi:uncharacterized protein LOC128233767 isoform X2 [Mya arenaria]|uniref:uncharacterized protein LOC128233767 isoform X2 n=1 Tax=Mya arenaria TaxID=6604 RepID=UPI0022DEC792|nr:uncharacterized protein LOC128233767 isoform X2 [Mya arenaria]
MGRMGSHFIIVVIFLNSVCRHTIEAQAPVLSANASSVTEGSPLNLVCGFSATPDSVTWLRKETTETSEQTIVTVGLQGGLCISIPSTLPDGLVVTCGTSEYGCTIPSLSISDDGDVWRCSVPITGVTTNSNSLRMNVTESTTTTTTTTTPEYVNDICVGLLALNIIQVVLVEVSAFIKLSYMGKDTAKSIIILALLAFATGGIGPCLWLLLLVVCKKEKSCRAYIGAICMFLGIMLSYIGMGFNICCIVAENSCWDVYTIVAVVISLVGLSISIVSVIVAICYKEKDEPSWVVYLSVFGIFIALIGLLLTILKRFCKKKPDGNAGAGNNGGGALRRNLTHPRVDFKPATANASIHQPDNKQQEVDRHRPPPKLPPVGGHQKHGRGLSANIGDINDHMPAGDKKKLPPLIT